VALAHPDEVVFEGPYFDEGRSFISTLSVVKHAGRVIGVVSIDALTPEFRALIAQPLAPGDIVSIESAVRQQDRLLGTAPLPADTSSLIDQSVPLRFTHSKVHIFSDGSAVRASDKRTWLDAVSASALVWVFAGMFGAGLMRNWRANEARLRLEGEQAQLEREIGVRKKVETELRRAAYTDALTGLPNRAAFMEAASDVLARRSAGAGHAVFFIDLDRFNMINDTLGHLAGDEVLKLIAARLQATLPHDALITRLGGDEFVVIAPVGADGAGEFAASIVRCLQEPMLLAGRACYTAASVGVVLVDAAYAGPEYLLRDADIAMYRAKEAVRARFVIFDATMRNKVLADSDLENSLRRGIERGEFVPFYQPIVSIETREVTSFEALVRWNRPGSGIVGAADFIAYAEARGLIEAIDSDVFRNVCADARSLFARFPSATIAVNISAAHLTTPGLAAEIAAALAAHGIPADRMKLEITETAIMSNAEQARATLDELHDSGMQLLVDDFGAGHSSLSYLHRLPIAGLKIDRSFVTELESGRQSVAIVRSIVALAQTLGLYTVAEGVENEAQLEILRDLGVVFAQGYFFSPALSLAALLDVPGEAKRYG
jgi:diguanylate cyclase (GGDEF)-like protein